MYRSQNWLPAKQYRRLTAALLLLLACFVMLPVTAQAVIVADASPLANFPSIPGQVTAVAAASDGSVYLGGTFSVVDASVTHTNVVHILASGAIDPIFTAQVTATSITALALDDAAHTLYVGGVITAVNAGVTRNNLAAVNSLSGAETSFAPVVNAAVTALNLDTTAHTLYVGGAFTQLDTSVARNHLGAFDTTSGVATAFNPNVDGTVSVIARNPVNSALAIGGTFTHVGATARSNFAVFDSGSSTVNATDLAPNAAVTALSYMPDGTQLFIGGSFTVIAGAPHNYLVSLNTVAGTLTSFTPSLSGGPVAALLYVPVLDTVFAGGSFTSVEGQPQAGLAEFRTLDGAAQGFAVTPGGTLSALASNPDNSVIFAGGNFAALNATVTHSNFAAFSVKNVVPGAGGGAAATTGSSGAVVRTAVATTSEAPVLAPVAVDTTPGPAKTPTPKPVTATTTLTPKAPVSHLGEYIRLGLIAFALAGIIRYIYVYIVRAR